MDRSIDALEIVAALLLLSIGMGGLLSCSTGPRLRAQAEEIQSRNQSIQDRAVRCAPKEFALAESQIKFGLYELNQGQFKRAQSHIYRAEKYSKLADKLSTSDQCRPQNADVDVDKTQAVSVGDEQDQDGDGIADINDSCPDEPEDFDGYEDADGCPDLDNDGDGIADTLDECPSEAEDYDGDVDDDGCPEKRKRVDVTKEEIELNEKVHFAYDKAKIQNKSYPLLDEVATVLKANPNIEVRIEGHTDSQGGKQYNQKLSQRRAQSVVDYLVDRQGIDRSRLQSKGFGESQPIASNRTEEGRAANRRVEMKITSR